MSAITLDTSSADVESSAMEVENQHEIALDPPEVIEEQPDRENDNNSNAPEEECQMNISAEDILGTERLLMSDSEDEDIEDAESKKENPNVVPLIQNELKNNPDTEKESPKINNKSMKINSDTEDEDDLKNKTDSNETLPKLQIKPRIIDSDTEEESKMPKTKKFSALIDSESELENNTEEPEKLARKKRCTIIDSDSETDDGKANDDLVTMTTSKQKSKISSLIDSDSNSDKSDNEGNHLADESKPESEGDSERGKKSKIIRASAKKAMDDMQAIQSEQQRLHREAHISIPYHKPKRHTLQEFLKRRTIIKPEVQSENSPIVSAIKSKNLKMTSEELEAYAKLMEERAKEATEFFKSESEDEDLNDNTSTENMEGTNDSHNQDQDGIITEDTEINRSVNTAANTETDLNKNTESMELGPTITEVIELPTIDLNSINITPVNESKKAENIKRLIHEKILPESPSLKGDANMVIDLETGDIVAKKPTGVDNLLQRFLATKCNRKPKTSETVSILSTENGKIEISKVNISVHEDSDANKDHKPGAAYFKLKENLRSIISKKRREETEKRKADKREEELEHQKCLEDGDNDDEIEYDPETKPKKNYQDDILIDEEENPINVNEDEISEGDDDDELEENLEGIDTKRIEEEALSDDNQIEVDEDNDDGVDNDENDDDEDDEDEDETEVDDVESSKPKNRIIKAFQDDSDEDIDLLRTPTQSMTKTSETLFDDDAGSKNRSDQEIELLGLCSGQFDETQGKTPLISQIPITQTVASAEVAHAELLELCSGTFDEIPQGATSQIGNETTEIGHSSKKIISSDEENSINIGNTNDMPKRTKKLTKKMSKKKAKLGFSDDEDDETTNPVDDESEKESVVDENDAEDVPETFIDYDSEENEIVVQMTKKDCVKQAENFFEKEAELSESDWGSADEDEKNLDKYDIELGDEEEFDRVKLQTELGQIHARKMLDEDIREVRKIQEMLFEDEEKDGVGRQRQFKWKNIENGFSLDDPNNENNPNGENGESGDEENEQLWRKIRYEREQLLKEQGLKENSQDLSTTTMSTSVISNTTITAGSGKKLNIITAKKTTSIEEKKASPFLISKNMSVSNKKNVRGSFLVRDKETLLKLAGLTKAGINDVDGAAGTVSAKAVKPKNFVFATLTEEEHANLKRKSDDLLNSSSENGINYMKKSKIEPRRDKCLIDQLL